jgi:hypothetical protein
MTTRHTNHISFLTVLPSYIFVFLVLSLYGGPVQACLSGSQDPHQTVPTILSRWLPTLADRVRAHVR